MTTRRDQPDAVRGVLAGALGAMLGDSTLFLVARRSSSFVEPQLARARANPKSRVRWPSSIGARRCCY